MELEASYFPRIKLHDGSAGVGKLLSLLKIISLETASFSNGKKISNQFSCWHRRISNLNIFEEKQRDGIVVKKSVEKVILQRTYMSKNLQLFRLLSWRSLLQTEKVVPSLLAFLIYSPWTDWINRWTKLMSISKKWERQKYALKQKKTIYLRRKART